MCPVNVNLPLQTGACRYSVKGKAGYCSNFRILPQGDEKTLQAVVASVGPVAVAVNARLRSFHLYKGGEAAGCLSFSSAKVVCWDFSVPSVAWNTFKKFTFALVESAI